MHMQAGRLGQVSQQLHLVRNDKDVPLEIEYVEADDTIDLTLSNMFSSRHCS